MDRSGTEDLGLTAKLVYGYILSNTNVLTAAETSFVVIAALIPQDVRYQNGSLVLPISLPSTNETCPGQPAAQGTSQRSGQRRSDAGASEGCARGGDQDLRGSRHEATVR